MNCKSMKIMVLIAALAMVWGCSSDDDDNRQSSFTTNVGVAPSWKVNFEGDEARPDWADPDPSQYEYWSVMIVKIEKALKLYTGFDDLLALFVDGELRGLSSPAVSLDEDTEDDSSIYLLKAYGNEVDQKQVNLTLCYYCSRLKQVFSRSVAMKYEMEKVYGLDEDLIPQFTLGPSKYPVVFDVDLLTLAPQLTTTVTPEIGDMVAVFVGDECRGVHTLVARLLNTSTIMTVYGCKQFESYTVKYYQHSTNRVITFSTPIILEH